MAPASGHNAMSYATFERLVCHFMLLKLIAITLVSPALVLTACSHPEPLQTSTVAPAAASAVPITDQTVIAETVGRATVGSDPLAWANPSTGSAGVIEQIRPGTNDPSGCRDFVTSKRSLEGVTRFNGVACPADGSWKINGSSGLF
ncbi:RT0821/Lpp0805 family surface protein [Rhizobium leguminosarum]|uniref:RT0821/Lpp0805 family surface protein n=1 Tax=Rhizobium leguminosarum TaxID=384 RepID=UPI0028B23427|nr:RT0821/Lpp0805 family surface protein [Rhizobium leguminosarum]